MDMSGGAAVLEAVGAIAELGAAARASIAVVPSTENMPSGTAIKPGDIITQLNGKTVEVNNTDAEGRLILADALTYCVELGADRLVDLATLTGAVLVALGSTYAALISNDDDWADQVERPAETTGELAWRLPLHPEYKELTKGTVADLTNASAKRKAGTIYAGSFLEEFVDDVPWAHLDIAGTAWDIGPRVRRQGRDRLRRAPAGRPGSLARRPPRSRDLVGELDAGDVVQVGGGVVGEGWGGASSNGERVGVAVGRTRPRGCRPRHRFEGVECLGGRRQPHVVEGAVGDGVPPILRHASSSEVHALAMGSENQVEVRWGRAAGERKGPVDVCRCDRLVLDVGSREAADVGSVEPAHGGGGE